MATRRIFEHFVLMLGLFFVCGEPFRFIRTLMGSSIDGYYNDPLRKVVWLTFYAAAAIPIKLNGKIFAYNSSKKAFIQNAFGGPYQDLVKAAEKCTARVIHPGLPANTTEKNMDQSDQKR